MRKLINYLIVSCILLLSSEMSFACKEPLISGPPIWPPHIMRTPEGSLDGTVLSAIDHVITPAFGLPKVDGQKPWRRVVDDLKSGSLDVALVALHAEEREAFVEYTKPWQHDTYGVVVRRDNPLEYSRIQDLAGLRGGYLSGIHLPNPYWSFVRENLGVHAIKNLNSMYTMLDTRRLDYLIVSVDAFFALMPEEMEKNNLVALTSSFQPVELHMAISKASSCAGHVGEFNRRIDSYVAKFGYSKERGAFPIR